jgi:hypothetical protein
MAIPFEVHITGDSSILKHACSLGIKTIEVDLLRPNLSKMRTEYMTSYIFSRELYSTALESVFNTTLSLTKLGVDVERVKIECPYINEYIKQSLYLESHWDINGIPTDKTFPLSKNRNKHNRYLATDRTYDSSKYEDFKEKYKMVVTELCLFDSNLVEDFDWFKEYGL